MELKNVSFYKEKGEMDSHFRGNDIRRSGNDIWGNGNDRKEKTGSMN